MIKLQKLLGVYKNKFNQLKNAYDEVEREKEHVKVKKTLSAEHLCQWFLFEESIATTTR